MIPQGRKLSKLLYIPPRAFPLRVCANSQQALVVTGRWQQFLLGFYDATMYNSIYLRCDSI